MDLVNYAANGTVDSSFVYTYSALEEVTSMATIDGMWTYGYDNDGELVTASFASTDPTIADQSLTYIYNAAGDRTQTIINGVTTDYTSNSVNEYTTVGGTTYEYDADGNLISMTNALGTTTYSYNSLNQLTGVTSPEGSWSYQYDALGNVVATTSDGQTTNELVDPTGLGNLVGQYTTSGSLIAGYTYGLGLVSQITPSGTNYYQFDALGSTADMTSATGGVVASYSYLPFGGLLASTGSVANSFTYVGQYSVTSNGSGLLDMRNRAYDPTSGQFVSNDPLGLNGGDTDLRRYAENDPIVLLDPSGTVSQFIGFSGGFGLSGTLGITFNDNGQGFLTLGLGATTGGATIYSFSSSNASAGESTDFSGTLGWVFGGITATNSISDNGYSGSLGGTVGFKPPGVTVQHTWNIPLSEVWEL